MSGALRVVGVGHPGGGDDAVGLAVVDSLRTAGGLPPAVTLHAVTDPADLPPLFEGARAVIVVDAVQGNGVPGELTVLEGFPRARARRRTVATHGLGLEEAIALGRTLWADSSSPLLRLVGIAIGAGAHRGMGLSAPVAAAVEPAAAQVCALLEALGGAS